MSDSVENGKAPGIQQEEIIAEAQPSGETKYMTIKNNTYEVVYNYVGDQSLLDIVKSAIKRDVESGLF